MSQPASRVFEPDYAALYDSLHQDKDYDDEVRQVLELVGAAGGHRPRSVLDVACGTGRHLAAFLEQGVRVWGNDLSPAMIARTRERLAAAKRETWRLTTGPMEELAGEPVDLCCAFYTALGYLVDQGRLDAFLARLGRLLTPGGYFFADLWNGDRMSREYSPGRVRTVECDGWKIERRSVVTHDPQARALRVRFAFHAEPPGGGRAREFTETHVVRYHTVAEMRLLFEAHGFRLVSHGPFLEPPSSAAPWNFYVLARKETP